MTQARNLSRLLNKKLQTYKFTATSGQTTFSDSDDAGLVMSYTPENMLVTYNGVVLENGTEYTATNGTSVVLDTGADSAAEVNVYAFESVSLGGYLDTSTGGSVGGSVTIDANGQTVLTVDRSTSDGTIIEIQKDGSVIGSISGTSSGTTYNTTSDRRLKENIEPIVNGTEKLLAMKPSKFNFIADENKTQMHGFIAQEMQEVMPEAVSDGTTMSMDYGRITPVIVAALQDALREIEQLKTKIAELETK